MCVCVCVCVLQPSIKGVSKQAGLGEFPLVLFWEFGRLGEEHGGTHNHQGTYVLCLDPQRTVFIVGDVRPGFKWQQLTRE